MGIYVQPFYTTYRAACMAMARVLGWRLDSSGAWQFAYGQDEAEIFHLHGWPHTFERMSSEYTQRTGRQAPQVGYKR